MLWRPPFPTWPLECGPVPDANESQQTKLKQCLAQVVVCEPCHTLGRLEAQRPENNVKSSTKCINTLVDLINWLGKPQVFHKARINERNSTWTTRPKNQHICKAMHNNQYYAVNGDVHKSVPTHAGTLASISPFSDVMI